MGHARSFPNLKRTAGKFLIMSAAIVLTAIGCAAQTPAPSKAPDEAWIQYLNKYPGLLDELIRLVAKLQHDVQYPPARNDSHLLPLLPESVGYAAIPNYGDSVRQSLAIFNDELQHSEPLRNWWQHGEAATVGPKIVDWLRKFSQFSQYLGPEIVVAAPMEEKTPRVTIVAQITEPGLKDFLQQRNNELANDALTQQSPLRILEPRDLATADDNPPATSRTSPPAGSHSTPLVPGTHTPPATRFFVLLRPDFLVATSDLAALKKFNARLDRKSTDFASTPFGQRIAQAYADGGVTIVGALDLHKILGQLPDSTKQSQLQYRNSGFADMNYFVWERKSSAGEAVSQMELSFTGPRHGAASWLAKPAPMGALDFASPHAAMVGAAILTAPAQIFADLQSLSGDSNLKAFAALAVFEQAFKVSLKEDFLSQLTGGFMVEMVNVTPPTPGWRTVFGVKDAGHIQQAFNTLVAAMQIPVTHSENGGVDYYAVQIPSGTTTARPAVRAKPTEVTYAFADGYLIVGSSQDAVAESIRLHKSGESLAKSPRFLESLPPGHESGASALFYQDSVATSVLRLQPLAPEYASYLEKLTGQTKAQVFCLYGDNTSIRGASRSGGFDAGAIMIVGAIAIPNLLRARVAANAASAVGTMRVIASAQAVYHSTYPQRGYAPDLATFGRSPDGGKASADHGTLIDDSLGNPSCTAGSWCVTSGYRFTMKAECIKQFCDDYVAVATPVAASTGTQNYCSTSDAVVRFKSGSPVTQPTSVAECRSWPAVK
jgi:hypothetical protein